MPLTILHQVKQVAPAAKGYYWFAGERKTSWGKVEKLEEPVWVSEFGDVYLIQHSLYFSVDDFVGEWQLLKEGS